MTNDAAFGYTLLADIDRDNSVDLLLCCYTPDPDAPPEEPEGTMIGGVFWGDGSGDFSAAQYTAFPRPSQEWSDSSGGLLPIDIDGDEDMDLVVGYNPSSNFGAPANQPNGTPLFLQVLVNQGERQFVDESASRILTPATMGLLVYSLHEVDFNLDSCPDFVVQQGGSYWAENIYLNDCRGRFSAIHRAIVGKMRSIIPIDVHGDGDLDFVSWDTESPIESPVDFAILEKVRPFITTLFADGFETGDTSAWSRTR